MMRLWRKKSFEDASDIISLCKVIAEDTCNKSSLEIEYELYMKEYYKAIRSHLKSVCMTEFPFYWMDSVKCDLLFELAHNATNAKNDVVEVKCYPCKRLVRDLNIRKR